MLLGPAKRECWLVSQRPDQFSGMKFKMNYVMIGINHEEVWLVKAAWQELSPQKCCLPILNLSSMSNRKLESR